VLPLFYRRHIDMTTPWTFTYYTLLIPVDGDTANIDAVIKPFQWPVCIQHLKQILANFKWHLNSFVYFKNNNVFDHILFKGLGGTWNIDSLRYDVYDFKPVLLSSSTYYFEL